MENLKAMKKIILFALLTCGLALSLQARNLDIYWVDVEGGGATLIVTPDGQSLLVDTGNPAPDDRDAKRIFEAAQKAGLKKIDYVLITHFHGDHVGGAPALAKLIPIDHFLDHGDSIETQGRGGEVWEAYKTVAAGKRTTLKPGDKLPLKGVDALVVSSNGQIIAKPVKGAGAANPYCEGAVQKPADTTENQRSAGILLTYGKFKFLDLGDLTWDIEMQLACPVNKLGTVTLFQATHHGFFNDFSGAPPFVLGVKPQVVVVNNGATKGWQNSAWETVAKIPQLEDVWQLHRAMGPNRDHNVDPERIANLEPTEDGHGIMASVASDGKFTLTNERTGFSKTYTAR
jgi:beta-lactamase superfamily II metal-dependent hydrolase